MKAKLFILLILAIFLSSVPVEAKKATHAKVQTKKHLKKTVVKKKRRKLKYVAPAQDELLVQEIPLTLPIPIEAVDSLARSELEEAVRILRVELPSSRSLHLMRDAQKIVLFNKNKKVPDMDKHHFYRNIGIAYHNLFLFLKRHNISNKEFYKSTLKFYGKAGASKSLFEKAETKILEASLKASAGELVQAEKIFSKIDAALLEGSSQGQEYLASYFAATGNVAYALRALNNAHEKNPAQIALWVAIGDDFAGIENKPEFKKLVSGWKDAPPESEKDLELELPKNSKPKLK